jgi:hypothetical protein
MTLSPEQEEFLRDFFARQREISKESLLNVSLLAKTNIQTILQAGLISPPTIEKAEELLLKLKLDALKRKVQQQNVTKLVEDIKEIQDGD